MGFARCRIWMGDWKAVLRCRKGELGTGTGLGPGKGWGRRGVIGVQCGLKWWFGI